MMKLSKNIRKLKKAALVAFASVCLSFIFISNSSAQKIKAEATSFANKEIRTSIFYSQKSIVSAADEKKNAVCDVQVMRKRYQESCYSCMVVKTLTEAFMKGCSKVYPVSRDAGSKIAIIGAIIWIVIFAMKNVSSFTSLEPANNVNDLLVFLFKVLVALVFINAGIGILVQYIVEPILMAGADYGMGIVVSSTGFEAPTPDYSYNGIEVISTKSINKLFGLNQAIDKVVSENLVIGNTLICHSMNAGAWVDASLWIITLKIPNFWIMICGAAIWFAGFMLTLSISYYVLDVSFKLGFAIMLLPVAIGLWPFEATKKKLSDILSIIFKSAAIFAFLAITTSYSLNMISAAIGGVDELYTRIANDDATWISEKFEITGSFFILIIFAYLYSLKMIGGTIGNYVNKFFSDSTFGNTSPIHNKATQATDIAKQKGMGLAKGAAKLGGKAAVAGAKGLVRSARGDEKGGTTIVGNARKAVGRFAQFAGRKASQAGDLNRKLSQNLQNFSDKQVAKGTGKKNILHLAAGGLAGKMAAANANLPGVAKVSDISSSLGVKMQKWGDKQEQKGKDFNAKYRGVKTHVKNAINEEVDLAKDAAKQGTAYVNKIVKDGVDGIKDDAKQVGNAVKNTKVYQAAATGVKAVGTGAKAVGSVAERAGTALSNGYVTATTATKGAIVGAALKTAQTASEIGNKAVNLGKRTAVYKAGKYTVNKTVQGASYVGNKTVQGAQVVRSTTIDTAQRARDAVVDSAVYKGGEKVVDGIVSVDRSVRDAAITARSTVGSGVGATRDFTQGINNSVKGAVNGTLNKINDQRKRAGAAVNAFIYKGLGGERLAEKLTGVKETLANNEPSRSFPNNREQQQETKKETYSREEAIKKELEKVAIDYTAVKEKERRLKDYAWSESRAAIEEAKRHDALAKNAGSEEERVKLKSLANQYRATAKDAAMIARIHDIKLKLIHEREYKRKIDSGLHAKIIAGNAFRDSLSEKEKKIYDNSYASAHKHMNREWNEKDLRRHAKVNIESITRAEKFGISDAVIEGQGYSYTTDSHGHFGYVNDTGYSYVSPDALNEADRKLYDSLVEKGKKDGKEGLDVDYDFLAAKNNEIIDKMHQEHARELDEARGIYRDEEEGLTAKERDDLALERMKKEDQLNHENMKRKSIDTNRKDLMEEAERRAEKELEEEAEKQRGAELDKIKERVIKREEEMMRDEASKEAERAKEREQEKAQKQETEEPQETEQNKEKERAEKEQTVETENKRQREEDKKKDNERKEKLEKDKKEAEDKRKEEEEARRKDEEEKKNQQNRNRTNFENEYSDLLRKYNVTDTSSVENLSDEQRRSLKDGIEKLKGKYKQ